MIKRGKVLAIISPKGGSGKTVTVANLAAALSSLFNYKVLAIDTNITTASLGLHFGILYPKVTIYDVLKKNFLLENAFFRYNNHLSIVPATMTIDEEYYKDPSTLQNTMGRLITHYHILLSHVIDDFDLIILDSAPGFNMESLTTMNVADGNIIVTNPEYPSIAATVKMIEYAKIYKIPVGGVILNKVRGKNYEPPVEELEKVLKQKIIKEIPFDDTIPESISSKIPVVLYKTHSPASRAYKHLAADLIGKVYEESFFEKIKSMLGLR